MSSIERQLAPKVASNKQELTDADSKLRGLNLQFPGERRKKDDQKDPEYLAQRSIILAERRILSARQYVIRRQLRKENLYGGKSY